MSSQGKRPAAAGRPGAAGQIRTRLIAAVLLVSALGSCGGTRAEPTVVIGTPRVAPTPPPTLAPEPGPREVSAPQLAPDPLAVAGGRGPGAALPFRGAIDVPDHLLFFLFAGSDARPGQPVLRSRADAIHVAAVNPFNRRGTVLGIPRDSYVEIPGHGAGKINSALAIGGPQLLTDTVQNLTGFPISYWAVTGFEGLVAMVDALGGLDVHVQQRMNDRASGARFEAGWHHMDGRQVLAFTRNRRFPDGDFTRTRNHNQATLHGLEKLRAETSDDEGIRRFVRVLFDHASLDMPFSEAVRLGTLARQLVPADLSNVVATGSAGRGGTVVLDEHAYELFRDIGADAVADGRFEPATPPPTASPSPSPSPSASPSPSGSPSASPSAPAEPSATPK